MYPLFHGMRSKKTEDQIQREGFCSYGSPIDEARHIISALRHFGREKLITANSGRSVRIRQLIAEVRLSKGRLNTWASTDINATCSWWSRANPEHVSLALNFAGISEKVIDRYLKETFGNNCYSVELKMTSLHPERNFNTGLNCVPPNLIRKVKKCKTCDYSGQAIETNL